MHSQVFNEKEQNSVKMFRFVKGIFVSTMIFFSCNLSSVNPLECVSMNYQECKIRPEIVSVSSNEPVFYLFNIKTSKCSGGCNNINDPHAKLCVTDVIKNINMKIFNLISRTYETRRKKWLESCKCKCRLHASVCNNKQFWNKYKCICKFKELIEKGICDKWFIWNPSICICVCDKSCDVVEYLDYANCKCIKKLVHELVDKCTKNIDKVKIAGMTLFELWNDWKSSCTIYPVLIAIVFAINIGIGTYFIYYKFMNHDKKLLLNTIMSM